MRGQSLGAWAVLVAMAAVASCATDQQETSGERAETPLTATSLTPSSEAHRSLSALRDRFRFTPSSSPDRSGRAVSSASASAPVIGEGMASAFEPCSAGRVRAFIPPEAKHLVARTASVELPLHANGMVRLEDDTTHLNVGFALRDASDAPITVDGGVALYAGALAGGDVVHRVHAEGTEDFVVFQGEPAREAIAYDVDVSRAAGLRLVSNTLEFLDESGAPRLRVAPPYVVDANGARSEATLAVEGCAYDTNASAPWGRAVTKAGAPNCVVRVTWSGVSYPLIVDPSWTTTGSMATKRDTHTATLLQSNLVLVTGGYNQVCGGCANTIVATAELYDPTKGTFGVTGSMAQTRAAHTATLLPSGNVLVAGGVNVGTAELYDAGSGMFTATTGPMTVPRWNHTATLLTASGEVLLTGGYSTGSVILASAELYAPTLGNFAATGSLTSKRAVHTATLLSSGKVLIAGGSAGVGPLSSADLFDGIATFTLTGPMVAAREYHTATLLPAGKVLLAGGYSLGSAELFDGISAFASTSSMAAVREFHTATLLPSGKVLLAGGDDDNGTLSSVQLFSAGLFTTTAPMNVVREHHTATLLPSGQLLVVGGKTVAGISLATAEIFGLPTGASCDEGDDCGSGVCNEKCCTSACAGSCMTCDATGACLPVESAEDPNTCSATLNGSSCDATGVCKKSQGTACTLASTCITGFCADGFCCDSACGNACDVCAASIGTQPNGTCGPAQLGYAGNPACGMGEACDGKLTMCLASCASDNDCLPADYCSADGTCQPSKTLGMACKAADCKEAKCKVCATAGCVDGFCCDKSCGGLCLACAAALKQSGMGDGTCGNAKLNTNPHNDDCPVDPPMSCGHDGLCDGTGACSLFYPPGTSCGASMCAADNKATGLLCDGSGVCAPDPGGQSCGNYLCASGSCPTTCTADTDCAMGSYCLQGACVAKGVDGVGCIGGNECASTICADGVCCAAPCLGQCEACNVKGAVGACVPIAGTPVPPRTACPAGSAASICSAAQCDGIDRDTCNGFIGSSQSCREAGCTSDVQTLPASCDGKGDCPTAVTKSCAPYACGATACNTTCAIDKDCSMGSHCVDKACLSASTCAADGETVVDPGGTSKDCAPYACAGGACLQTCGSIHDCAAQYVCDGSQHCVAPSSGTPGEQGGCAIVPQSEEPSSLGVVLGLGLVVAGLRRRRRASTG